MKQCLRIFYPKLKLEISLVLPRFLIHLNQVLFRRAARGFPWRRFSFLGVVVFSLGGRFSHATQLIMMIVAVFEIPEDPSSRWGERR